MLGLARVQHQFKPTFNDLPEALGDELLEEELRGQVVLLRELREGGDAGLREQHSSI